MLFSIKQTYIKLQMDGKSIIILKMVCLNHFENIPFLGDVFILKIIIGLDS